MKKRLIASVTCLSMLLIMLLGSTLAWFTDSEMSHNIMTVGNVEIKQYEQDRNGADFQQNQKLFPAVIKKDANGNSLLAIDPATGYWTNIYNAIDKKVTVKNTGSDPAYVRTVFAFEMMWNGAGWDDPINDEVVLNCGVQIVFPEINNEKVYIYRHINTNGSVSYTQDDASTADAAFVVGYATYGKLDPKQTSAPSLKQFYLDEQVDGEFYEAVKHHYEILVLSQAVQTEGFVDVSALDLAFGAVTASNAAGWFTDGSISNGFENGVYGESTLEDDDPGLSSYVYTVNDRMNSSENKKIATLTVSKDSLAVADPNEFRVIVVETEYEGTFSVAAGMEQVSYDISVSGLVEDNDTAVKVELYVGKNLDSSTVQVYHYNEQISAIYNPTSGLVSFETKDFSPFTVVFDADSESDPGDPRPEDLPVANVVKSPEHENVDLEWKNVGGVYPTAGLDSQLEAAYTFSCKDTPKQAKESPYANWHCDFYVMLDKDLAANQIFLGGNYGDFGWVGFHNGDLTLDANTEIPLLGSVTQNPWTYAQVAELVGTFICGVGDVDDALNGATFTVMLRLTNPEDETEFYNVATINYTFERIIDTEAELKAAVQTGGEIEIGGDITLTESLVIPADKTVTIDLNGFALTYESTVQGEAMITNKGTLSINDSSEAKTGEIFYNYIGAADSSYGKGNYTISNGGTLTVNGGKISIADLPQHAKYPIDNNSTSGNAVLVINGGHLYNYNTSAIRQFCNSTTNTNSVTINGGLIEGYCAIWVQNPGSKTVNGQLTITGGEIKTTAKAYVNGTAELKDVASRIYFTIGGEGGAWSEGSFVSITGGTFNENVNLADNAPANINVDETKATFNGKVTNP